MEKYSTGLFWCKDLSLTVTAYVVECISVLVLLLTCLSFLLHRNIELFQVGSYYKGSSICILVQVFCIIK